MKKLFLMLMLGLLVFACGKKADENMSVKENQTEKEMLVTSLPPLKWIVEQIAGDEFSVVSIVKPNMNHELFEPQPEDLKVMENSKVFFTYDALHFEKEITELMENNKDKLTFVLSGVDEKLFLKGHHHHHDHDKDHDHDHDDHKDKDHDHEHEHEHDHDGLDPHVWFSLDMMSTVALNIKDRLVKEYPDKAEKFNANYTEFINKLEAFKTEMKEKMATKTKDHFMSYHPTLAYFLKDYKVEEISVEYEGKEPSAKQMQEIIEEAKEHNITTILVQPQFPKSSIEIISKEIPGAKVAEFNADEENVFDNLRKFVDSLE